LVPLLIAVFVAAPPVFGQLTPEEREDPLYWYGHSVNALNLNQAVQIVLGDASAYDSRYRMDPLSVARVGRSSLRILRNTIYALRGYAFSDPALLEYFSRYDWYEPRSRNVEDSLTPADRDNIRMVQAFEAMDESAPTITWTDDIVGVWQQSPIMNAGWGDRFVFYPDGNMEFLYSQMSALELIRGLRGTYRVQGNVLIFSIEQIEFIEHGTEYDIDWLEWTESSRNTATFERPIILRLPVGEISLNNEFDHLERLEVSIGGVPQFRMSADPNPGY
jgi:hypothetical protein